MKGIIIEFFEEKKYGFLMDEEKNVHFFHLNDIKDTQSRKLFISNIQKFLFTDIIERDCYIVEFSSIKEKQGLKASNIELTDQIFNAISDLIEFNAKVIGLKFEQSKTTRIVSGIRQGKPVPFGATSGGNGTYRIGYPEHNKELNIYFRRIDDIGWGVIDVYELALTINGREKISDQFIDKINKNIINKTLVIFKKDNKWFLKNDDILKLQ